MSRTVVGLFHSVDDVEAAVRRLESSNFTLDHVSLVAGNWDDSRSAPIPSIEVTVRAEGRRAGQEAAKIMALGHHAKQPILCYESFDSISA